MYPVNSITVLLILAFRQVFSKHMHSVRRSSCHIVDDIRQHNTDKIWWWSLHSERPHVFNKHFNLFIKYSKQWMVFSSELKTNSKPVIEIAHRVRGGKCRFLVKKRRRGIIGLSQRMKCQPGLTGEKGMFRASFESLTDRLQISCGPRDVSQNEEKFLGLDGVHLVLSKLRQKHMCWWTINLNKSKRCRIQ